MILITYQLSVTFVLLKKTRLVRSSKSCGHPIIGMSGCCVRCHTRVHESQAGSIRAVQEKQVAVLSRVQDKLAHMLEKDTFTYTVHSATAKEMSEGWTHELVFTADGMLIEDTIQTLDGGRHG